MVDSDSKSKKTDDLQKNSSKESVSPSKSDSAGNGLCMADQPSCARRQYADAGGLSCVTGLLFWSDTLCAWW